MVRDLLLLYLREAPGLRDSLGKALAVARADGVRRAAHALKGTLGSIAAQEASAAAEQIERLGRIGALDAAGPAVANLDQKLERLRGRLQCWLEPGSEP